MKCRIWMLGLLLAPLAVPASAEVLGVFERFGQCEAAWALHDNEVWDQARADGSMSSRGRDFFGGGVTCVKRGDLWYLVTLKG